MTTKKIEFYKMRDFGQKLNATIEFIRGNFGKFFQSLLYIAGPTAILMGIAFKDFMGTIFNFSANPGQIDDVPGFLTGYFVIIVVSVLAGLMLTLTTFSYMELYRQKEPSEFSAMDVLRNALSRFGPALVLTVLVGIVVTISFFFLFLPALYFSVVLCLAFPILFFEKKSPLEAFKRTFRLITEKWWSTFGLIFVSVMISYVVSLIFSVPFYVVYIFELVGVVSSADADPTAIANVFSSWYMALAMVILTVGAFLSYAVPIVAIAFQYFNLAERTNATGLINKIEDFENIK